MSLSMDAAEERFRVSEHLYGAPGFDKMLLVEGDLELESLDLHDFPDPQAYGYIIDGNLSVRGAVESWNEEVIVMSLLLTGDAHVGDLFAGGADMVILGDLKSERFVIGQYNHGYLHVGSDIETPILINSDHDIMWGGELRATSVDAFHREPADAYELGVEALRQEIFDDDGDLQFDELVKRLRAGDAVLK